MAEATRERTLSEEETHGRTLEVRRRDVPKGTRGVCNPTRAVPLGMCIL
jgi:hypothetical protein